MILEGSTTDVMPLPARCAFPDCGEWGDHEHHITYDPPVTKRLCHGHHEQITHLNGQQARKYRHELSNKHRWWIWFQWVEGKLKPRRTRKALEWTDEWQAKREDELDMREIGFCPNCNAQIEIDRPGVHPFGKPVEVWCGTCNKMVRPDRVSHALETETGNRSNILRRAAPPPRSMARPDGGSKQGSKGIGSGGGGSTRKRTRKKPLRKRATKR